MVIICLSINALQNYFWIVWLVAELEYWLPIIIFQLYCKTVTLSFKNIRPFFRILCTGKHGKWLCWRWHASRKARRYKFNGYHEYDNSLMLKWQRRFIKKHYISWDIGYISYNAIVYYYIKYGTYNTKFIDVCALKIIKHCSKASCWWILLSCVWVF